MYVCTVCLYRAPPPPECNRSMPIFLTPERLLAEDPGMNQPAAIGVCLMHRTFILLYQCR
jgi:hypothetical protein